MELNNQQPGVRKAVRDQPDRKPTQQPGTDNSGKNRNPAQPVTRAPRSEIIT